MFCTSGARAGAPAVLLGTYQGASQPVFQPPHMVHPVVYGDLNGQNHVVGSNYYPGVPHVTGMLINVPAVTSVPPRVRYNVPKADVRPCDHSASVCPEHRDTLLEKNAWPSMQPKRGMKMQKTSAASTEGLWAAC